MTEATMQQPTASRPEISLVVNTFQKPRHLRLVLESIAAQQGVSGRFEVVISDDGSTDDTASLVDDWSRRAAFPIHFLTRPHDGFRLAEVRNRGTRVAAGDFLLFLDGDCILPPDHLATYLSRRRTGTALLGGCGRLTRELSDSLDSGAVSAADPRTLLAPSERRLLTRRHRKSWWQSLLRHPSKPRLVGNNFGVWASDYRRVNGFDERFLGWGQEDDDFGLRLRAAGVRLESILDATCSLHVWHPTEGSVTKRWRDGGNVGYFLRRGRLTACRFGLKNRSAADIVWGLPDDLHDSPLGRRIDRVLADCQRAGPYERCEVDVVVRPGRATFQRPAECRLLMTAGNPRIEGSVRRRADRIVPVRDAADGLLADEGLSALFESVG